MMDRPESSHAREQQQQQLVSSMAALNISLCSKKRELTTNQFKINGNSLNRTHGPHRRDVNDMC